MAQSADQSTSCPICEGPTREYCRKRSFDVEWMIDRCQSCGHAFVRNRPSMDMLKEIYAGVAHHPMPPVTMDTLRTKADAIAMAGTVARLTAERGRVLDVGCGDGAFSYHLHDHGFGPIVLIDLDRRAQQAGGLVPESEFRLTPYEHIEDGPYTVIVMSQTLEHSLDPIGWLERARRLMEPNGVLAIALPNFGGVYRLLGTRDPMIIPPVHLSFFTEQSLRLALDRAGFRIRLLRSRSRIRVTGEPEPLSFARVTAGHLWNLVSLPLNWTTRGIFLNAFAQPVKPAAM